MTLFQQLADGIGTYILRHPATGEDQWVLILSEDCGFTMTKKTWAALGELCESTHLRARLARLLERINGVGIVVVDSGRPMAGDVFVLADGASKGDEMTRDEAVNLLGRKIQAMGGLPALASDEAFWLFDVKKAGCGWDYDLRRCPPELFTAEMRQVDAALRAAAQQSDQDAGQVVFLLIGDASDAVWIGPGNGPSPAPGPQGAA